MKYNKLPTKEEFDQIFNKISMRESERQVKMIVMFPNKKVAKKWFKKFDNLIKEEIKKLKENEV
jgi:RNase P protein component